MEIRTALYALGALLVGYGPVGGEAAARRLPERAHSAVFVVGLGEEIRSPEPELAGAFAEEPGVLVDGRNVLDAHEVDAAGKRHRGFGRGDWPGLSHEEVGAGGVRTWRGA